MVARKGLLTTIVASVLLYSIIPSLSSIVLAAPLNSTTTTSASASESVHDLLSTHNIIRSIGFRDCATDSLPSNIRLSNLALLYNAQSNTIFMKVEGTADKQFDAGAGK